MKYLLHDNRVAKFFLSILIGEEVVDLQLRPTEHATDIERRSVMVFRIDFAAKIRSTDGSEKLVIIEIQKAKYATDIMRFRKYLGQQYASENNVAADRLREEPAQPPALPILSIYLLGHKLDHIREPVIRVQREYRDMRGNVIKGPREDFDYLGELENLERAIAKREEVIARQDNLIARKDGLLAEKEGVIAEKEGVIAEKEGVISENKRVLAEKERALAEKERALAEKDIRLERAVAALVESGISEAEARRRVLG